MDLIKKHFWLINFLAIGLSAGFAGRAASHWAEDLIVAGQATAIQPPRRVAPQVADKTHSKEIGEIVKRNIFCSGCTPVTPSDSSEEGPSSREPQRSTLQLELISTMVVPSDERWSMAVIRDNASKEKDTMLYARGSQLPGGSSVVMRVIERKVYFQVGNHIEYLEIDGGAQIVPAPQAAVTVAGGGMEDQAIGNHVRCTGTVCEIDRSLVEQLLANTASLATAARFVPSIRDGRPNGFKLYAIRPGSIFSRLGMQNADTIKAINGMEMSSPDQALSVYSKLRSASHLTVTIERKGETTTLDYTIR